MISGEGFGAGMTKPKALPSSLVKQNADLKAIYADTLTQLGQERDANASHKIMLQHRSNQIDELTKQLKQVQEKLYSKQHEIYVMRAAALEYFMAVANGVTETDEKRMVKLQQTFVGTFTPIVDVLREYLTKGFGGEEPTMARPPGY